LASKVFRFVEEIIIRKYRQEDRQAVRDIAWQTAFMGVSADAYFTDKEVLSDFLTLIFTDFEPESSFVACKGDEAIGYLIGSRDIGALMKRHGAGIGLRLIFKALFRGVFFRKKNLVFIRSILRSLFKGELKEPDLSAEYPATLHINLCDGFRAGGIGSRLISAYFGYLRQGGVSGVHLATFSEKASVFFRKQGFNLVFEGHRSYFRYIIGKDSVISVFGKKL